MPIEKAELGPLREISAGAYGRVFRAPGYRLPGNSSALAYKEFTTEVAAQATSARKAVEFRARELSPAARALLDQRAVWPLELVADQGVVKGLLMPLIPDEFFFDTTDPFTDEPARALRELQYLIADDTQLSAQHLPPVDETDRLALLAQLVYVFRLLHRNGWVYGDLSFMNAAYAVNPPRIVLLDCDGAASESDPGRRQAHSIGWKPPECAARNVQDTVTDVYKLGLAVMRCLNPGVEGIATLTDPGPISGKLDAEGEQLIARAVGKDRSARPAARELYSYLRAVVAARIAPPEVVMARLATPMRARGMDVRVEWQVSNVQEVKVTVGANPPATVPNSGGPQVHVCQPQHSGPVTIEAANRYGQVRIDLGELTLYELPRFDPAALIGALPRPAVPALGAFTLDAVAPALATVPRVPVPELPSLPAVPTADLTTVLRETLLPGTGIAAALRLESLAEAMRLPDLGALAAGPAQEIRGLLTEQAKELAERQRHSPP